MAINWTEAQIEQIVASVMKNLNCESPTTKNSYDGAGYNGKKYIGVYADMNDAIDAARIGYKAIRAMRLEEREKIIDAKACSDYMKKAFQHIGRGAVCGVCMRVCPKNKR